MNTTAPRIGAQHIQNFAILAPLLGLDINMNPQYTTWSTSTQISILRGSLMFKIGHHTNDEKIANRINTTVLNLSAAELLALLSDSAAFDTRVVVLQKQYTAERRQQGQNTSTSKTPSLSSVNVPSPDERIQISEEDEFASERHGKTPEQRNGESPLARANQFLFGLGSVAVGGVGGMLRTASGTALGLGQAVAGTVASTGRNTTMSPVHRSQSERLLGSSRSNGAGMDEWEMMDATELDLDARIEEDQVARWQSGRRRQAQEIPGLEDEEEEGITKTQRAYRPSRPGLEDDLADAMNGRL